MVNINSRNVLVLHLAGLVFLCGILFFSFLDWAPFFDKGEPREALVVQEIFAHGNWLFPLKRGEEVPSKPPLFHWFAAMASKAWGGLTEATVRFPSALFATVGVLSLYFLGRRLFDPQAAFLGAIILSTSVPYQSMAISARVDMTLTFFVTLALVIFYLIYRNDRTGNFRYYCFYFILGIGILAKGPVGLVLPGMVIFSFVGLKKRWDLLSRISLHPGVILTLVIGMSWYGTALMRGGEDFFNRQLLHENLARFFVYGEGGSGHQKPFYYYFPYLILGGLPWSLFLPFAMVQWFKDRAFSKDSILFLLLWVGIVFFFFSLSAGKRAIYLLPLYPPLSLLIGLWLAQPGSEGRMRLLGLKSVGWLAVFMGLTMLAVFLVVAAGNGTSGFLSYFEVMLKPKDRANLSIVQQTLDRAGWFFLPFLFSSALLWLSVARNLLTLNARAAAFGLACLSVLTGVLVQGAVMPAIAGSRSYKPFVTEVKRQLGENENLYLYGEGWDYAPVLFYLGDRVQVIRAGLPSMQEKMQESGDYYIMGEREWRKIAAGEAGVIPVELRSRGTGPDGKDPIVLVRGMKSGKGK